MSQELSNEAPKASRRAILTAAPVAAAAALAGGTVANALAIGMAKVAEADPIFAVIAAHRACIAELCAINDFVMNASDDTVLPEDIDERTNEANDRRMDAELILLTTDPTSVAGVVAALEYLSSAAPDTCERETFLEYASGWGNPEIPHAARNFPARMAAALRHIVERGQA